jgi:hypothetical protein
MGASPAEHEIDFHHKLIDSPLADIQWAGDLKSVFVLSGSLCNAV